MIEWAIAVLALSFCCIATVNALTFLRPVAAARGSQDRVSVLIPARNEEQVLDGCIASVVAQGSIVAEVLVYDDQSSDGTRQIATAWAQRDRRVRVIETVPLPDGWYGKPHACYRLACAAQHRWMLFLDADTRLQPNAIEQLIATAQKHGATLLSAWPAIEMRSFAERVLMPMLNFYVMTLYPSPMQLYWQHPRYALAHGSCLLCDRQTYFRIRGHACVRRELFEDTALARHWRSSGERALCCDGSSIARVRMYRSIGEIWRGFQKNFYPGFRRKWLFPIVLGLHAVVFTMPLVKLLVSPTVPVAIAAGAVGVARLVLALRFRHAAWSVLLHPVAELFLIGVGLASLWRWRFGSGVEWKQRRYRVELPRKVLR